MLRCDSPFVEEKYNALKICGGGSEEDWWFGISPEGFGTVAMIVNFAVSLMIAFLSPKPPEEIQELVENIRIPSGAGEAYTH